MNSRKTGYLMLTIFALYQAVSFGLGFYLSKGGNIDVASLYFWSEMIFVIPALFFLTVTKCRPKDIIAVPRIKISSVLMGLLYAFLCMPLISLINLISQLFTTNVVSQESDTMLGMGFGMTFLLVAVLAPLCEEFVFRGVIYGSAKKNLSLLQAMLMSSLFFGLAHMNLNQFLYAFAMGILAVLLYEASGSIVSTVLFHFVFNGFNVVLMFGQEALSQMLSGMEDNAEIAASQVNVAENFTEYLIVLISVFLVISLITTTLAMCVLAFIAKNEGRADIVKSIWKDRKITKGKMVSVGFVLTVIIYFTVIIYECICDYLVK